MSAAAAANPKTVAPAKATWKEKLVQKAIVKKVAKKEKAGNYEGNQILAAIIAIFLPWLGVLVYEGTLTSHFWISLLLWLLLYVPGLIYALLVIFDVI
ncbi:MAG: YqaE/Pmp3 family membrane protein [Bacteroidetes bacterium]|nr:YqaE/Pmp3 family membrane protein [Bacteroidota bacterium]